MIVFQRSDVRLRRCGSDRDRGRRVSARRRPCAPMGQPSTGSSGGAPALHPGWAGSRRQGLVRMRRRVRAWLRRYAAAELAATLGALLAAAAGARLAGPGGAAVAGALGETVAFYGFVVARELRAERRSGGSRSTSRRCRTCSWSSALLKSSTRWPYAHWRCMSDPCSPATCQSGSWPARWPPIFVFYTLAAIGYEHAARPLLPVTPSPRPHWTPALTALPTC